MSFYAPSAFQNWGPIQVLTAAASGPLQTAFNRQAHTGLVQFSHSGTVSGMVGTLQVRHVATGSYLNWPCIDLASGARYEAGDSITSTDGKTLAFDARDVSDVQLTYASGAGSYVYWGWSSSTAPQIHGLPVTQSGTWAVSGSVNTKTILSSGGVIAADTDLIAAVSQKRIKVISYSLITTDNTGVTAIFKSGGTSGTELWRVYLKGPDASTPFGANLSTTVPGWLFGTVVGEKLTLDVSSAATIHWSLTYHVDDAA